MNISRSLLGLLAPTVVLIAAGCGSGSPTSSEPASPPKNGAEAAFRYSSCMRSHGVSNFPDPVVHSSAGHQEVGIKVAPALTGSPQSATAQKACAAILPPPNPSQIAQQQRTEQQGKLAFARCLRSHGVTDFPDPTPQGQLTPAMLAAAGIEIHTAGFRKDAEACASASNGVITRAQVAQALGESH